MSWETGGWATVATLSTTVVAGGRPRKLGRQPPATPSQPRAQQPWPQPRPQAAEILGERGRQFDPDVVDAFRERAPELLEIRRELALA